VQEKIVAFDIGTRSVVGIILEKHGEKFDVIDLVSIEHGERSMLDGQIHDVLAVSKTIQEVKLALEEKHGPIKKVSIAAAGRTLKTQHASFKKEILQNPLTTEDDILHLELSAVQQAQMNLAAELQDNDNTNYYCAGYSVLRYKLDGIEIGSLIDQQGQEVEVEIIATFLPKVVVESLISALQRANLEMDALTLEPIAAINVLIPQSMRRLNVALVDIGAGTSDIAITNYGTVIGYGMVPIAGDEITEAISNHYLLDFPLAEEVKRKVTLHRQATALDILGNELSITYEEMAENISPAIDLLANRICEAILQLNHKAPQAVMLVGGGSLTPELNKRIANLLRLPENRVAIRGTDAIQSLNKSSILPEGPAFVTPIGIAIAAKQSPIHYVTIRVNNRPIRLFELKELTIGDGLLASGININKLYGKPGMAIMVTLNGKTITIPGTLGDPPTIMKNGLKASLNDSIQTGDEVIVEQGQDGSSPLITVDELLGNIKSMNITLNGEALVLEQEVNINGKIVDGKKVLQDGDSISYTSAYTVESILKRLKLDHLLHSNTSFTFQLNGKTFEWKKELTTILVNHKKVTYQTPIHDGDRIDIIHEDKMKLEQLLKQFNIELYNSLPVQYDSKEIMLSKPIQFIYRNGKKLSEDDYIYNGDVLTSEEHEKEPFIFQDIFRYIDLDLNKLKGKQFKLYVNGQEASFITPLAPHDKISIRWIESIFTHPK
jgi:cell division protein FtsA